jgi:hypothetical protein
VATRQLECRIVITRGRADLKTEIGMYDPLNGRYEALGEHGPARAEVDRVIHDLKRSIERAGHRLTFCERTADAV